MTRKAGFPLVGGESIEVARPRERPAIAEPEDIPLRVLYEDDDLLAIDKPPGMVVHPAPGAWHGTVVNALLHRGLVSRELPAERPGIVHRLDKETSGVLLVARHERAQLALSRAFRERRVRKTYLAIVLGVPRSSPREARTRYSVVERFDGLALLRLHPETGRTHQIRVHLAAMGHPVLADPLYGAKRRRALPPRGPARSFSRQALHASEIELAHPVSGAILHLVAPTPDDMSELLRELREAATSEDRS